MTQLSRVLRVASLTATAGGAVLAAAGGACAAEAAPGPLSALSTVPSTLGVTGDALRYSVEPVLALPLDPLSSTSTDPLSNSVGTQIADFQPISTSVVTGPLTDGAGAGDLPGEVLGGLLGGLPITPTL
ncbi:hypothetical protein [Streptomyces avicenniae]|uniref:hypothetical protein n=1 Tax=Streptomyces avicenniae TaxID=500153 RepID=UPI00069A7420|nr:hypothetical protein [Streptomyces avicenniae]